MLAHGIRNNAVSSARCLVSRGEKAVTYEYYGLERWGRKWLWPPSGYCLVIRLKVLRKTIKWNLQNTRRREFPTVYIGIFPGGGWLEYLHRSPASRKGKREGNPVPGEDYNWATISLRTETWGLDARLASLQCCETQRSENPDGLSQVKSGRTVEGRLWLKKCRFANSNGDDTPELWIDLIVHCMFVSFVVFWNFDAVNVGICGHHFSSSEANLVCDARDWNLILRLAGAYIYLAILDCSVCSRDYMAWVRTQE
jgi:hypothetical protein